MSTLIEFTIPLVNIESLIKIRLKLVIDILHTNTRTHQTHIHIDRGREGERTSLGEWLVAVSRILDFL